ncbi:hypothetical protein PhaeoP18_03811 (plasmid) [Phaeobacter piscinae]|uniref:Uncharacterized protein n=1 Tax=Phaeobacter piscinae TaxID=1580596 RepID=A0AAN1LCB2_9RHOB|nr:hypothetical protein PhaeoP13_03583 [Phaeobacter piscinae]AUR38028.1 hypothetical protein PhaeoP18_03811 [Phaeobacter piscinae]
MSALQLVLSAGGMQPNYLFASVYILTSRKRRIKDGLSALTRGGGVPLYSGAMVLGAL